jgi:hypothetical protein
VTLPSPTAGRAGRPWPTDYRQVQMFKDKNGNWREQGTGQFVPKHLWPPDTSNVTPIKKKEGFLALSRD